LLISNAFLAYLDAGNNEIKILLVDSQLKQISPHSITSNQTLA